MKKKSMSHTQAKQAVKRNGLREASYFGLTRQKLKMGFYECVQRTEGNHV